MNKYVSVGAIVVMFCVGCLIFVDIHSQQERQNRERQKLHDAYLENRYGMPDRRQIRLLQSHNFPTSGDPWHN